MPTDLRRKLSFKKEGDILEVKLSDEQYNLILKEKVRINNKKQMMQLMIQLKQKGVNFPDRWLD